MDAETNMALARRLYEALERGEAGAAELLALAGAPGSPEQRESLRAFLAAWRDAVPDLRLDVEEITDEGDGRVTVRATLRGTHLGPLMGMQPSGAPFALTATDTLRFSHGRLVV